MEHAKLKFPKARKDHKCNGCCGKIKRGSFYVQMTFFDSGVFPAKLCPKCFWVLNTSDWYCDDTWSEGELKQDHKYCPADVVEDFNKVAIDNAPNRKNQKMEVGQ